MVDEKGRTRLIHINGFALSLKTSTFYVQIDYPSPQDGIHRETVTPRNANYQDDYERRDPMSLYPSGKSGRVQQWYAL
jgi:hypothetical protein